MLEHVATVNFVTNQTICLCFVLILVKLQSCGSRVRAKAARIRALIA